MLSDLQMKKDYHQIKELRELSGFGWDSEKMMVTAHPESVWTDYAKVRVSTLVLAMFRSRSQSLRDIHTHQIQLGSSLEGSPCSTLEGEAISPF